MTAGEIDCIVTPRQGNKIPDGAYICADNGCFGKGYPGDEAWWEWVSGLSPDRCRFAVAPDVVGDAVATLQRSSPWLPRIRSLGIPAAFVAQDGLEDLDVPWDAFDVLFIGGSTEWKLGPAARRLVSEAKRMGKWGAHGSGELEVPDDVRGSHRVRFGGRHVYRVRPRPEPAQGPGVAPGCATSDADWR